MKTIKRIAEVFGLMSPFFILLFTCAAYIRQPAGNDCEKEYQEEVIKTEKTDVMKEMLLQKF